jgi:hypothetical protein
MADSSEYFADLIPEDSAADIDMGNEEVMVEIDATSAGAYNDENGLPFQEEAMEDAPARVTYIDYLKSPVIGLLVGQGDEQALLTAHQALLTSSPWFADACAKFSDEVSVSFPKTLVRSWTTLIR